MNSVCGKCAPASIDSKLATALAIQQPHNCARMLKEYEDDAAKLLEGGDSSSLPSSGKKP